MEKTYIVTQEDLKELRKRWYHPRLDRKDAENLLKVKGKPGSFLVRPSSKDASQSTLSIRVPVQGKKKDYEVKHITICQKQSNEKSEFSLLTQGGKRVRAFNIHDLLFYHMNHPLDIGNGRTINLKHVINCEDPAAVSWFHGFISPEEVERRLTKRSAFLMHETSSEPGMYTLSGRTSKASKPCKVAHIHVEKNGLSRGDQVIPQPPIMQLSMANTDRQGAYLMDTGFSMCLWLGAAVTDTFCQELFDVPNFHAVTDAATDLPEIDTPTSERLRLFIGHLNESRPFPASLTVIKEDSRNKNLFLQHMVEDRTESTFSYYEFLQHLQKEVGH